MSGIAGILHLDGAPADRRVLEQLAAFQKFRGPDGQHLLIDGPVGLAHALLRTSDEFCEEPQPFQLGDKIWIAADARVDARSDLLTRLKAAGQHPAPKAADSELILLSYRAWGEKCLDYLLGDFSFAIWDAPKQKLFCARDHMGVKPFYYARLGELLVFANTLDCIRQHPAVTNRLNDLAIADFLLFDVNQDPGTTAFADIRRLPAAHALQGERGKMSVRRYWTLSVTEPVHYQRESEYIERFRELLNQAVADRLRTKTTGILMSGGLDSTTVAAAARRMLPVNGAGDRLFAHTVVLSRDGELDYASAAASALKIPIDFRLADPCRLFDGAEDPKFRTPYPEHSAWPDQTPHLLRSIGARSRIALTGNGGDPALSSRISVHFRELLGKRQFALALHDAANYVGAERRSSRLYLRGRLKLLLNSRNLFQIYPRWLNPEFAREWQLYDRWKVYSAPNRRASLRQESKLDAVRPEAIASLSDVGWQDYFESLDYSAAQVQVEVGHPFFDLRLVAFLLALPRLPWCCDKELLRRSARGVLPDHVRLRRKSPLRRDPVIELLRKPESAWVDRFRPLPELARYVCRDLIPSAWRERRSGLAWVNLKPLSLNFWLRTNVK